MWFYLFLCINLTFLFMSFTCCIKNFPLKSFLRKDAAITMAFTIWKNKLPKKWKINISHLLSFFNYLTKLYHKKCLKANTSKNCLLCWFLIYYTKQNKQRKCAYPIHHLKLSSNAHKNTNSTKSTIYLSPNQKLLFLGHICIMCCNDFLKTTPTKSD